MAPITATIKSSINSTEPAEPSSATVMLKRIQRTMIRSTSPGSWRETACVFESTVYLRSNGEYVRCDPAVRVRMMKCTRPKNAIQRRRPSTWAQGDEKDESLPRAPRPLRLRMLPLETVVELYQRWTSIPVSYGIETLEKRFRRFSTPLFR